MILASDNRNEMMHVTRGRKSFRKATAATCRRIWATLSTSPSPRPTPDAVTVDASSAYRSTSWAGRLVKATTGWWWALIVCGSTTATFPSTPRAMPQATRTIPTQITTRYERTAVSYTFPSERTRSSAAAKSTARPSCLVGVLYDIYRETNNRSTANQPLVRNWP